MEEECIRAEVVCKVRGIRVFPFEIAAVVWGMTVLLLHSLAAGGWAGSRAAESRRSFQAAVEYLRAAFEPLLLQP